MAKFHLGYILIFAFLVYTVAGTPTKNDGKIIPEGCSCPTTDDFDPVCGNNGVTYPNLMTLRCVDKCVNYNIDLIHHGPCRT